MPAESGEDIAKVAHQALARKEDDALRSSIAAAHAESERGKGQATTQSLARTSAGTHHTADTMTGLSPQIVLVTEEQSQRAERASQI